MGLAGCKSITPHCLLLAQLRLQGSTPSMPAVQYAYELASTRRALKNTSINSYHQDQARGTASNPPSPH
eukprot:1139424-Pelagomonas_calceolata.AAC.2